MDQLGIGTLAPTARSGVDLVGKCTHDPSVAPDRFAALFEAPGKGLPELAVLVTLGNGFIITSMLWASFVVALIDQKLRSAAAIVLLGAAFTAFGIIHSVQPAGGIYLPWELVGSAREVALQFTAAYLILAALFAVASVRVEARP